MYFNFYIRVRSDFTHHHYNIGIFRIHLYLFLYWWCSYFFHITDLCPFISAWNVSISCKAFHDDQLFQLSFVWKIFCLSSKSQVELCQAQYSWLTVFFISILNISSHCLLVCKVSAEKYTDNLTVVPLYLRSCFSLCL